MTSAVNRPRQRGFSLIELMVAVAIVGVLAAIAIPLYRDYITRAKISEGLTLAQPLKAAVGEYYALHGGLPELPNNNWTNALEALGMPGDGENGAASGTYVKRIYWHNNTEEPGIYIRYAGGDIDDKLVYLEAAFQQGAIRWHCTAPGGQTGVPARYLPNNCRDD